MTKKLRIKRCPFCGSRAELANDKPSYCTPMYVIRCLMGCATTPEHEEKEYVLEWWNSRYTGPAYPKD